jgi:hypothetical protein
MFKKQLIYFTLLGFILALVWKIRQNITQNVAAPVQVIQPKVITPVPSTKASAQTEIVNPQDNIKKNENKSPVALGLCRYFKKDAIPLLPRNVYLHLIKSKSQYILLPKQHAECLQNSNYEFRIVDYEPQNDVATNYYAKINLILSRKTDFINNSDKKEFNKLDFKKYGFESLKKLTKYLFKTTAQLDTDLVEFKIESQGFLNWPKSSSDPGFFPGVTMVSMAEMNQALTDRRSIALSTYDFSKDFNFKHLSKMSYIQVQQDLFLNSSSVVGFLGTRIEDLIKDKNNIYIYQEYAGDSRAQALAVYIHSKHSDKKVFFVKESFFDLNNYQRLTPQVVPQLKIITDDEVFNEPENIILIDTRRSSLNSLALAKSYWAPVNFSPKSTEVYKDLTGYFSTFKFSSKQILDELISLKNNYSELARTTSIKNKKIVLYGTDDADYSPIIFWESLKSSEMSNIYWLRSGLSQVQKKVKLKALSKKSLRRSKKKVKVKYKNKNKHQGHGKNKKQKLVNKQQVRQNIKNKPKPEVKYFNGGKGKNAVSKVIGISTEAKKKQRSIRQLFNKK